jgi:hypothetical protein
MLCWLSPWALNGSPSTPKIPKYGSQGQVIWADLWGFGDYRFSHTECELIGWNVQMVQWANVIVLKERVINILMTLERKIMRKIYGATRTDGGCWRSKTNQGINDKLKGKI